MITNIVQLSYCLSKMKKEKGHKDFWCIFDKFFPNFVGNGLSNNTCCLGLKTGKDFLVKYQMKNISFPKWYIWNSLDPIMRVLVSSSRKVQIWRRESVSILRAVKTVVPQGV